MANKDANALVASATLAPNTTFGVKVNYDLSLREMIRAGKYDYTNEDITAQNFPVKGSGQEKVAIELVHFNRDMEAKEVLKEFEKKGLRPATLAELLAFGVAYPEQQRDFPIVELGSVWKGRDGDRLVAYLWGSGSDRELDLDWRGRGWDAQCRFAGVRK